MASNMLSHWRSSNNPSASIYETIRQHDEDYNDSDIEEQAGLHAGASPQRETFRDTEAQERDQSQASSPDDARQRPQVGRRGQRAGIGHSKRVSRPRWLPAGRRMIDLDDADDDVPASLLIEGEQVGLGPGSISLPPPPSLMGEGRPRVAIHGHMPQDRSTFSGTAKRHVQTAVPPSGTTTFTNIARAGPHERASWRWANVVNLDNFLIDLYGYYLGSGFWSILLRRFLSLATIAFVVGFTITITRCVDYSKVKGGRRLEDVWIQHCTKSMGLVPNLLLWTATFLWVVKAFEYILDIRRLRNMHDFYHYLLNISEAEVPSISWQEIVSRLMALRDSNPTLASTPSSKVRRWAITQSKQRMDAHDIANRLMRKENYMIAMVNKDILDMSLPIPWLRHRQFFTRTLEWNLNWCVMDFVFNSKGQIRPIFLKDTHRKGLSEALKRRFIFAGWANLIIAPFLIVFFVLQNFFIHFNEYQKNPSAIGSKDYNVLAEWKFREFNELGHLFRRRINMSQPFAARYVDQFPRDKTVQLARFLTFASGAVVSVLAVVALFDQENFLTFELSPGRTVLFWLGAAGGLWAVARGLTPEDNTVYEPAFAMQEVIDFTHYEPAHWHNRLHTVEVKSEFEQLYQMKLLMFIEEVFSMILTPFVLWYSLPKCSDRIIDFVREFTVHVDGIGYVCSFAEFKLRRPVEERAPTNNRLTSRLSEAEGHGLRDDYFASKDQKLEQSYWGFMNDYARNPKADVRLRFGSAKRRLNMPPPIPGLLSPTFPAGFGSHDIASGERQGAGHSPRRGDDQSGASHVGAQAIGSPLQSLLLDPHHQPSASGFGSTQAQKTKIGHFSQHTPRRRALDRPADVVKEDDETNIKDTDGQMAVSTGELGSWKYDDAESVTSDTEDDQAVAKDGVLGLIRQMKTQGEGNRIAPGL